MKKLFIYSVFVAVFALNVDAQNAIVPVGGNASGSGGSVSYTVGQVADKKADANGKYIIEGVQQPYEIQTVGVNNYPGIQLEAMLFPNPTNNYVQLRISNYEIPAGGLNAVLYDNNGKLLEIFNIKDEETKMDLSKYPSATYQLRVSDNSRTLKTFKVVKNKM